MSYQDVMNRKQEIMRRALKLDYEQFEYPGIGFDYEKMMASAGFTLDDVINIQKKTILVVHH
jgi:hypothetical protein